ncbi:MAG TPA: DinB family protein [Bryobacteraceae bacterium]|nr:DinB family protein [Bryobacteraceae bacterium]
MTISETLLPEFDHEMANTKAMLECVPEDKFSWKPHEKSMTMGRLASHCAEMASWAVFTINQDKLELTPDMKPFNASTKKELLDGFAGFTADARKAIQDASDADLGKTWSLIYGGKPVMSMPRASVLRSMVMNHIIHHRAQLSVYLRLNNIPIPGMYGPSADSPRT